MAARDGRPSRVFVSLLASATSTDLLAYVPCMENSVKFSGGAAAALLAMRCAGSLRSACVVGVLSGLFAHSLYADVLRKRRRRRREKRRGAETRGRQGEGEGERGERERGRGVADDEEEVEEKAEAADAET
ncbi:unnamed protein product [Hyaloperonospora brassicae]|uniref:Uncharacterized protein n=1 Tax=Hyaloperonospora brassicae TaxID=162125 RepID=A0AAV0UG30_HYABA|nr:unnamed protein product [Hyaloperonospora brassicae]